MEAFSLQIYNSVSEQSPVQEWLAIQGISESFDILASRVYDVFLAFNVVLDDTSAERAILLIQVMGTLRNISVHTSYRVIRCVVRSSSPVCTIHPLHRRYIRNGIMIEGDAIAFCDAVQLHDRRYTMCEEMVEKWWLNMNTYESHIQWLPRELLEDLTLLISTQ